MNKKVIAVFSLILYLLVSVTLFSTKIQEEMTTLVKVDCRTFHREDGSIMSLSSSSLFTDGEGLHLYEVRSGIRLQSGLRIEEIPEFSLNQMFDVAEVKGIRGYNFVTSASRQPQPGKLAQVVSEFQTGSDLWLYCYPYGTPPEDARELPGSMSVLGQTDSVLLTEVTEGTFPFLPHTALTKSATTVEAREVYSLTEAEIFWQQLPGIAIVLGIFLTGLLFWLCGCIAGCRDHSALRIRSNALAALATLVALWFALQAIDLPASLLPNTNIFDIAHYREEFTRIFDSLRELGLSDHPLFTTVAQARVQCRQVGCLFMLVCIGILAGEVVGRIVCESRTDESRIPSR